jgi:hypothetical protein
MPAVDHADLAHDRVVLGAFGVGVKLLQVARAVDDPAEPGREDVHDVADRHQHEHRRQRQLDRLRDHAVGFEHSRTPTG